MSEKTTCPQCKWQVEPADFCGHCGHELDTGIADGPEETAVEAVVTDRASGGTPQSAGEESRPGERRPPRTR